MRVVRLNFVVQISPLRWIGYLLLLISLFTVAYASKIYIQRYRELNRLEKSWSEIKRAEYKKVALQAPEKINGDQFKAELKAANNVISHLSLPWDDLFNEIESTMSDQVTLLSVEPDTEKKELRITAETKDFDGVLAYTKKLQTASLLQNVYVVSHQIQLQDPQKPVRFLIVAKWLNEPVAAKN